jgi:uncharacterized membrane-anchored protein
MPSPHLSAPVPGTIPNPVPAPSTMLNKVPEVALIFWIIKIMATTVGETGADFLNVTLGFGLVGTSAVMTVLFVAVLVAQLRARRYIPWLYWLTVLLISVVGTLITDNLSDNLHVSLFVSTGAFSAALIATFIVWYVRERTLSVHTIVTRRRELFYWVAILFTFALGTAGGDLIGEQFGLGYPLSALIFAGLIAAVSATYYGLSVNPILAFWLAYVLTRPLGASCGDLLSQPVSDGGFGFGTVATSAAFVLVIAALVGVETVRLSRARTDATLAASLN